MRAARTQRAVGRGPALLPIAWQVGRAGEVAGGMSQVVNGYLAWRFEHVEPRLIVSRDGSGGIRSVMIFLRAVGRIVAIRDTARDVVVVHLSQGGSFVREGSLLVLARMRGIGTVAQLHGSSFAAFAARHPRRVSIVLGRARRVMVLSDETRIAAEGLVEPARVVQLPNAVASGRPTRKTSSIVFGGSVSHRKGVDVLIAAWRAVPDHADWRLIVAGPVATGFVVDAEAPQIEFLGAVEHGTLMSLLDEAAIAVLPSRDEAMPMFILEAMARRAAVIATTVGGIPEVLADGAGVLVAPGDVGALTDALGRMIVDEPWREETARRGHATFLDGFSAQAVYPAVEECWLSASSSRGGPDS